MSVAGGMCQESLLLDPPAVNELQPRFWNGLDDLLLEIVDMLEILQIVSQSPT